MTAEAIIGVVTLILGLVAEFIRRRTKADDAEAIARKARTESSERAGEAVENDDIQTAMRELDRARRDRM